MAKATEEKEKKINYETPVDIKLDEVTTVSGQQPGCTSGSAATSCVAGGVPTSSCNTGGSVNIGDGGGVEIGIIGL